MNNLVKCLITGFFLIGVGGLSVYVNLGGPGETIIFLGIFVIIVLTPVIFLLELAWQAWG